MDRPNVLLLVVDSLRYDVAVGDWRSDTPTIDRLRERGVSFERCFSQGISTAPAMTSVLSGRLPLDYGGHWYLEDEQPTLAEAFGAAGLRTGAIHSNPYVSSHRNFDQGFDHFEEDVVAFEPDEERERTPEKLRRLLNRAARILSRTPYTPAETVSENVLSFVDDGSDPWFCWAQYMDVHGPYLGGDDFSYRNKFRAEWLWRKAAVRDPDAITEDEDAELRRNYRREVEYLDEQLGALLDALERRGELEDTIVVLTADHGDEFYEHGRYGHGNLPYDELIHVPLVMTFPEDVPVSERGPTDDVPVSERGPIDDVVRLIDVLPTVLDAMGAPLPDRSDGRFEGESFLPLLRGESWQGPPLVVTEKRVRGEDALRIGLRTSDWKYVYDGTTDETALYDLQEDPGETTDVAGANPEVRDRFAGDLEARLKQIEATSEEVDVPEIDTGHGVEQRLEALGYR